MKQTLLCAIAIVMLCACRQTSMFYNPEAVISLRNELPTDTVHGIGGKKLFSSVKRIDCIDRYIILTNRNKDTIFTVIDAVADTVMANFGRVGHARNEFIAPPMIVYCLRTASGSPLLMVNNCGYSTVVVDLEKSIAANNCVCEAVIKDTGDRTFNQTYHISDSVSFVYKTVSYDDARNPIYEPPTYSLIEPSGRHDWNIFPEVINPEWDNIVGSAYTEWIYVRPDGRMVLDMYSFIDILMVFDLTRKTMVSIENPDSYTYADIEREGSESAIKPYMRLYNKTSCVTDSCFMVRKDGRVCIDVRSDKSDDGYFPLYRYGWDGRLQTSYILDRDIKRIAYCESAGRLYGVSRENKLYRFDLK